MISSSFDEGHKETKPPSFPPGYNICANLPVSPHEKLYLPGVPPHGITDDRCITQGLRRLE